MPIENLSDNVRMPRLGKFHLGFKDPQRGFPVKTDYFVLAKDSPDYAGIINIIGEKPKELKVLIPSEDIEDWAPQYYKSYELTHGLVCKGDGRAAMRMVDVKTNALPTKATATTTMIDLDCPGKDCPLYKDKKCGEVMNLRFVLPDVPGLGVWQIDTGSINSILNINSCAKLIKVAFGRISNIPLKLTLEPIQVNNPENGKKQTVFVLNLRSDVTLAQLAERARMQSKQFQIEAPDMAAVYEEQVKRDIKELWPETGSTKPPETPVVSVIPQNSGDKTPDAVKDTTGAENKPLINLEWLEESLKVLKAHNVMGYSNALIIRELNAITGQQAKSVREAVANLKPEHASLIERFVAGIQKTRDAIEKGGN
jgi:hypothetical protein